MKLSLGVVLVAAGACATGCVASGPDAAVGDPTAESALGSDAYRIYADFATRAGLAPDGVHATVIGLRGVDIDGASHATTYEHAFDDTFVVLTTDGAVARFRGSTHPFEKHGQVPDVDHDGVGDVGMIRPGVYDGVHRGVLVAGKPTWSVTLPGARSDHLPGWRDTDHDGVLDAAERSASEARGDGLSAVLFHQGEGDAPPAVGCQVLPAAAMRAFTSAVGGAHADFRYLLVDMVGRDPSGLPR